MTDTTRKSSCSSSEDLNLILSFQSDLTSIYCSPKRYEYLREEIGFESDYLDNEDHDYYTSAWFNYKNYEERVDYYDNYSESWINCFKNTIKKEEKSVTKYTRSQFFDILNEITRNTPITDTIILKAIYQPIRQPKNPEDNVITGFKPSMVSFSICPNCLTKRPLRAI